MLVTCLLVFAAQMGVQTLPFLLSGELFASDVRAVCKGLCRGITCALLILSLKLYPALQGGPTEFFTGILKIFVCSQGESVLSQHIAKMCFCLNPKSNATQ